VIGGHGFGHQADSGILQDVMASSSFNPLRIGRPAPELATEALLLAFDRLLPEERTGRIESLAAQGSQDPLAGLLEARRGERQVGAVFAQLQPGKSALIWPPGLVPGEPSTTAKALVDSACDWLAEAGVHEAHALLADCSGADDVLFASCGFSRLADLLYLVSERADFPKTRPESPLRLEAYSPAEHTRLARLVEATYEHTLDCPALDGVRQVEDVLAGYRAIGESGTTHWSIVKHLGRDVGCLLLADHPQHGNMELLYMGLGVESRGQGLGFHLAQQAQWIASQQGRARLVLAVDARNQPALALYRRGGFRQWDKRSALLKVFAASQSSHNAASMYFRPKSNDAALTDAHHSKQWRQQSNGRLS
jgi:ribosomal protein S18 acetylase RimI-like enzyme